MSDIIVLNLLEISVAGAALILGIFIFRLLIKNYLPHRVFVLLWYIAILRLFLPFSIVTEYSWLPMPVMEITKVEKEQELAEDFPQVFGMGENLKESTFTNIKSIIGEAESISVFPFLWGIGFLFIFLYFILNYLRYRINFMESLPIVDRDIIGLQSQSKELKHIKIRSYDKIDSPLTYGIFRPVILLPKKLVLAEGKKQLLSYVIIHESIHIKRKDVLLKLVLAIVLALHWFNPFVWVMYILVCHDIEISCDEAVIKRIGSQKKDVYALALLHIKSGNDLHASVFSFFSKNILEERILVIMKGKKITKLSVALAVIFSAGIVLTAFAKKETGERYLDNIEQTMADKSLLEETALQTEIEPQESLEADPQVPQTKITEPDITFISATEPEAVITSTFGVRVHPVTKSEIKNDHITLSVVKNQEKEWEGLGLYAVADGVVEEIGFDSSMGNYIKLGHGNGLSTMYTHCHSICVETGDLVTQGDVIAIMGKTGRATGICVGFYVFENGEAQDPMEYLPEK